MNQQAFLVHVADLLDYPSAALEDVLARTPAGMSPAAAEALRRFADDVRPLSRGEREELYTRTFDINPVTSLEVGWHLYGEQYERGAFLVTMRELLRTHGVRESAELPDHLTHVLRLLGTLPDTEAQEFCGRILLPALDKMLTGFTGTANPYEHLLAALRGALANLPTHSSTEVSHV
jgi:nitrate reductase delta subunit